MGGKEKFVYFGGSDFRLPRNSLLGMRISHSQLMVAAVDVAVVDVDVAVAVANCANSLASVAEQHICRHSWR